MFSDPVTTTSTTTTTTTTTTVTLRVATKQPEYEFNSSYFKYGLATAPWLSTGSDSTTPSLSNGSD